MLNQELSDQILAILFVAKEPVGLVELKGVYPNYSLEDLQTILDALVSRVDTMQGAFEIREVAGGFRITTCAEHHEIIRKYFKTKPSAKLSLAALETLSVIAYRQPVTLPEIAEIRGVRATSTISTLLKKRLIEIRGRKKVVGRPIMYGTTKDFLIHFGLKNISELPTLEELEEILPQSEK